MDINFCTLQNALCVYKNEKQRSWGCVMALCACRKRPKESVIVVQGISKNDRRTRRRRICCRLKWAVRCSTEGEKKEMRIPTDTLHCTNLNAIPT